MPEIKKEKKVKETEKDIEYYNDVVLAVGSEDSPKNVYNLAQLPEANIESEEETETIDFEESEEPKPKYTIGTKVKFKNLNRFPQKDFLIGTITDLENGENGFYYTIKLDGLQYSWDDGDRRLFRCVYENELNLAENDQQSNEAI